MDKSPVDNLPESIDRSSKPSNEPHSGSFDSELRWLGLITTVPFVIIGLFYVISAVLIPPLSFFKHILGDYASTVGYTLGGILLGLVASQILFRILLAREFFGCVTPPKVGKQIGTILRQIGLRGHVYGFVIAILILVGTRLSSSYLLMLSLYVLYGVIASYIILLCIKFVGWLRRSALLREYWGIKLSEITGEILPGGIVALVAAILVTPSAPQTPQEKIILTECVLIALYFGFTRSKSFLHVNDSFRIRVLGIFGIMLLGALIGLILIYVDLFQKVGLGFVP